MKRKRAASTGQCTRPLLDRSILCGCELLALAHTPVRPTSPCFPSVGTLVPAYPRSAGWRPWGSRPERPSSDTSTASHTCLQGGRGRPGWSREDEREGGVEEGVEERRGCESCARERLRSLSSQQGIATINLHTSPHLLPSRHRLLPLFLPSIPPPSLLTYHVQF